MAQTSEIIEIELAIEKIHQSKLVFLYQRMINWLWQADYRTVELVLDRINYAIEHISDITAKDHKLIQVLFDGIIKKAINEITPQEHFIVGLIYYYELGNIKRSLLDAHKHLQFAADKELIPAIYLLGHLTLEIDKKNIDSARSYWARAADKQFAQALLHLGHIAFKATDITVQKHAEDYFKRAAELGSIEGRLWSGIYHLEISKNHEVARYYLQTAAKQGNVLALSKLFFLYQNDFSVSQNEVIASTYFKLMLKHAPLNQFDLKKQFQIFLQNITYITDGKKYSESLPQWAIEKGVCNGFVFMLFRAALIGEVEHYLNRLQFISYLNDDQMKLMGELFSAYRNAYKKHSLKLQPELIEQLHHCESVTQIEGIIKSHNQLRYENEELSLKFESPKINLFKAIDLYTFISSLLFTASPRRIPVTENNKSISQSDFIAMLTLLPPDQFISGNFMKTTPCTDKLEKKSQNLNNKRDITDVVEVFNFAFVFNDHELAYTIIKSILWGDMVIVADGEHKIYFSYSKAGYFFYDPSANDILILNNCQELVEAIKYFFYTRYGHDDSYLAIGLKVFSLNQSNNMRPSINQLISDILQQRRNNPQLEAAAWNGTTALYIAAINGNYQVAEQLLMRNTNVNARVLNGSTSTHIAARRGYTDLMNLFIIQHADLNEIDSFGRIALFDAILHGQLAVVEVLANHQYDFTVVNKQNGWNALHYAIYFNHRDIVTFLLQKYDFLLKKSDNKGLSPMFFAMESKDLSMIIEILGLIKNLNALSTSDIDLLNSLREKLVDYFLEGVKARKDISQKLTILIDVIKSQNALGQFFNKSTYSFFFKNLFEDKPVSTQKIMAYWDELFGSINKVDAQLSSVHTVRLNS